MKKLMYFIIVLITACSTSETGSNSSFKNQKTGDVPIGMILIPAGVYSMGGKSAQADADEFPKHKVSVSSFYMDATEVTNAQFKEFIDATGYKTIAERDIDWEEMSKDLPAGTPKPADSLLKAGSLVFTPTSGPVNLRDYSQWWTWTTGANWLQPEGPESSLKGRMDYPVVHIAWEDAKAYADWAGKRLPTEAEWEWAAMGGLQDPKFPWGNEPVDQSFDKANFWQGLFPFENYAEDGFIGAAPVKSFPPNGYELYDMAGNVWEWCQDKYRFDAYDTDHSKGIVTNPTGPRDSYDPAEPNLIKYVIRGGSFLCNESTCSGYRVSRRMKSSKDSGFNHTGFRCVKEVR
ncbi:MAG: formylglycine-generating enzyme family protein [Cytophagales bacterium]|nr:formylglycine-generating enzyme family protein [Cytophagales bacterium]